MCVYTLILQWTYYTFSRFVFYVSCMCVLWTGGLVLLYTKLVNHYPFCPFSFVISLLYHKPERQHHSVKKDSTISYISRSPGSISFSVTTHIK